MPKGMTAEILQQKRDEYNEAYEAWYDDAPHIDNDDFNNDKEKREAWNKEYDAWKQEKQERDPEPVDPEDGEGFEHIELPSERVEGDTLFKIGYFRSSYNSGGINSVLRDAGLPDLYHIFPEGNDGYIFAPDWAKALDRCKDVIAQFETECEEGGRLTFRATDFAARGPYHDPTPTNEAEALELFMQEYESVKERDLKLKEKGEEKHPFMSNNYGNGKGTFMFDDPYEAVGFIGGTAFMGPCVYVIHRVKAELMDSYRDALEIVQETIEHVLNSGEPERFYFHWSA